MRRIQAACRVSTECSVATAATISRESSRTACHFSSAAVSSSNATAVLMNGRSRSVTPWKSNAGERHRLAPEQPLDRLCVRALVRPDDARPRERRRASARRCAPPRCRAPPGGTRARDRSAGSRRHRGSTGRRRAPAPVRRAPTAAAPAPPSARRKPRRVCRKRRRRGLAQRTVDVDRGERAARARARASTLTGCAASSAPPSTSAVPAPGSAARGAGASSATRGSRRRGGLDRHDLERRGERLLRQVARLAVVGRDGEVLEPSRRRDERGALCASPRRTGTGAPAVHARRARGEDRRDMRARSCAPATSANRRNSPRSAPCASASP